jgi:glucokinase
VILAGDIGATKILLDVGEFRDGRWQSKLSRRYPSANADSFASVLTTFLGEWNQVREKGQRITAAGFGVAGPVDGNKVKMTHRPLVVDGDAIESRFLIPRVRVVNDQVAAALGIDSLGPRDSIAIQPGKSAPDAPRVVMGVGTGLGVAYLMPGNGGSVVVPGEGGHMSFGPGSVDQGRLWQSILAARGRVSNEDVVSGMGLVHVFNFVRAGHPDALGDAIDTIDAGWIAERAAKGDLVCSGALALFFECMGNVAGDHALAVLARGGVWLVGGVSARLAQQIRDSRFGASFCAKGPMSGFMMKIPVRAVTSDRVALVGAAKAVM